MGESLDRKSGVLEASAAERHSLIRPRRAQVVLAVAAFLAMVLLVWLTWDHIRTRVERERMIAAQVAETAAAKLTGRLQSIHIRLDELAKWEPALLDALVAVPDSSGTGDNPWSELRRHFPSATAALILNAGMSGAANVGDHLDESDQAFLRLAARGDTALFRLVRRDGTVYIDSATAWVRNDRPAGALLLRLRCAEPCTLPANSSAEGHRLQLIAGTAPTPGAGALGLGPEASIAKIPVGDTGWFVVDRLDSEYLSEITYGRLLLGLALGGAILFAMLSLYRWVGVISRGKSVQRTELDASQEKLLSIFAATMDGMLMTDRKGRIEIFSPAAEMMFGLSAEEAVSTSVFDLLPDFFSAHSLASLMETQAVEHAPPTEHQTRGRRKDGNTFPALLRANPVCFDDKSYLLIVARDLTERERSERHLVFLEQRDMLTGLLNRREFARRSAAILGGPKHDAAGPYVLCHIDVDRFKLINDTCGHEGGDALLKQLAILIKATLGMVGPIGRCGGDEFVVLFLNRTLDEARDLCAELAETVRNFLFTWGDQSFDVAVSIGLAEFSPEQEGPSIALSRADVACNLAKRHGRDRVHVYREGDVEVVRHHGEMHLISSISQALGDGRFRLYAQPIASLAAAGFGRWRYEILVRMVDEQGASIIPDEFIPAAERYILMPSVDRWVINRLFSLQAENLRAWHRIEPDSFMLSINLSGTSIADEGFLLFLKSQFVRWHVPHRSICFEITETAAISDLDHARAFIQELNSLGCTFALDDFGTGLSSFGYLKELPVEYLKIDGTFVREMGADPVSYALVESITQIGHVLGLKTIAEWAENQSTLRLLQALNVDLAQGFVIGEPIPVDDLTLVDANAPSPIEGTADDRFHTTHPAGRGAARSPRGAAAGASSATGLDP